MKKRVIVFSGLLLVSSMWMKADENETSKDKENTFSMSAQIRPRAEYRNGVLNPRSEGQEPAGFINNRARLSMSYERQNLSIGLSAQHVGVWGTGPADRQERSFHPERGLGTTRLRIRPLC